MCGLNVQKPVIRIWKKAAWKSIESKQERLKVTFVIGKKRQRNSFEEGLIESCKEIGSCFERKYETLRRNKGYLQGEMKRMVLLWLMKLMWGDCITLVVKKRW